MQKAIVCGVYQFLGFHLCSSLLESGIEIVGFTTSENTIDHLEEKKLEIGRNANFTEQSWAEFHQVVQQNDIQHIYIDLYSLNQERSIYSMVQEFLQDEKVKNILESKKVIILANISSLVQKDSLFWEQKSMRDLKFTVIYLPTLYGPWQPIEFIFQQLISNNESEIQVNQEEYTLDAIYIEDAVITIIKESEDIKPSTLLFKSNIVNHWKTCVDILAWSGPLFSMKDSITSTEKITEVIVINKNSIYKNLDKQKKHYELLGL